MIYKENMNFRNYLRQQRDIYRFGGPWARVLLASIPWVNVLVILGLLLVVHREIVITPGTLFDLPGAPLREGVHTGFTVLMVSVLRDVAEGNETLIFFDDNRYVAQDQNQMAVLSERLRSRINAKSGDELLLLADKRVSHGDVLQFVNVARLAGVPRICVAQKPE